MPDGLLIVGLGPADLERVDSSLDRALADDAATVIVRTIDHPAARSLAAQRPVIACDDLYETARDLDEAYTAIRDRVLEAARRGTTVYAVPGAATVGERTVSLLVEAAAASEIECRVVSGESFLDLAWLRLGLDPIARGAQIVDGRSLPDPLPLHLPTLITQVDRPVVLAEVATTLGKVLPDDTEVVVLDRLGADDEEVIAMPLHAVGNHVPGPRTTLYVDPPPAGWHGLVVTNRRLRAECPWDRQQTHHTLIRHLIEETYETIDALSRLSEEAPEGPVDLPAYVEVEDELGDLLLQVVFHATLAAEAGVFDVEEVAERIRRKLVRRHPHVFGDVDAPTASHVMANWEHLKAEEKGRDSLMDDVPVALPATARAEKMQRRAASVGFDWPEAVAVLDKIGEELAEIRAALVDRPEAVRELGDLLFAAVNLARHLDVTPEVALHDANARFEARFRRVEQLAVESGRDLRDMRLDEMNRLWEQAKTEI